MHSSPSIRKLSLALLAEVPILLASLGLLAWALHILAQSIRLTQDGISTFNFEPDQTYLYTVTQTVTGYRSSSVAPPRVLSYGPSTYTEVGTDGKSTPYDTVSASTYTFSPNTYGIDPTGTKLRTLTESGLQPISHRRALSYEEANAAVPSPILTPAPVPMQAVAQRSSTSHPPRLDPIDFWSLSSTTRSYEQYESVTVNRGFNGYFEEVGINYIYQTHSTSNDLPRVRALTTLVALALVSVIARLACTATALFFGRKQDGYDKVGIHRKLAWSNVATTTLLLLTYIPFWAIYGSWTHRSDLVNKADAEFQTDTNLSALSLSTLLHTEPWKGTPTALLVFWTLAVVTSIVVSFVSVAITRQRTKRADVY